MYLLLVFNFEVLMNDDQVISVQVLIRFIFVYYILFVMSIFAYVLTISFSCVVM